MNPVSRADVGVIPLWAVPTPVRREGAQATREGKPCFPCFNGALTPLPPPLQTRIVPTPVSGRAGRLDLRAVGGRDSRSWPCAGTGRRRGRAQLWLQRAGVTGPDSATRTHTRSGKAGSACSRARGCGGGTGGPSWRAIMCPLPRRPRTPK